MTPDEVLVAAAAWVYVPDDAREVRTDEHHVIAYPPHWSDPTVATSVASDRPAPDVLDAVLDAAASLGREEVTVWVTGATRPTDLEDLLRERGELVEQLDVLARPLSDLPDLDVPADADVRRVADEQGVRHHDVVGTEVFGGSLADDAAVAASVRRQSDTSRSYVAYRGDRPVGACGMTVAGPVARLWGGSVVEDARGSGFYRAMLDVRLREAQEAGCRFALVKGRVETSGPVLRRAGFAAYGQERGYRVSR